MDGYAIRLLCAAATFLFAALGTVAAPAPAADLAADGPVPPGETVPAVSYYVSVGSEDLLPGDTVLFYDRDGDEADRQTADADGDLAAGPFRPGVYTAWQESLGAVRFRLERNGAVTALDGCGWADGERLYLTRGRVSSLRVNVKTDRLCVDGRFLTLTLTGPDGTERTQSVYVSLDSLPAGDGYARTCLFDGLPPGRYTLSCEGVTEQIAVQTRPVECELTVP